MKIGKRKQPQRLVRRLPLLPQVDADSFAERQNTESAHPGRWVEDRNAGVDFLELTQSAMQIDEAAPEGVHSIPDMLKQDWDFARRLLHDDPAIYQPALDEWLGVLCAIAFAPGDVVVWQEMLYDGLAQDPDAPVFLRALAKSLSEMHPPVTSFLLFLHRTNDPMEQYVPVAYTYTGMDILLCPAAEISSDISKYAPPWYAFAKYEDGSTEGKPTRWHGIFRDPIPVLVQPAYRDRCGMLAMGLTELIRTHPRLEHRLRTSVLGKLTCETGLLNAFALRTDLLPELTVPDYMMPVDPMARLVEGFLSERLCLFHLRRNTRRGMNGEEGSFENCYGRYFVYDKDEPERGPLCEALLPLNEKFVQYLHGYGESDEQKRVSPAQRQRLLETLHETLRIEREVTTIQYDGEEVVVPNYSVSFTLDGKTYQKQYHEGMFTQLSEVDRRYVPAVAVWPPMEDPAKQWREYFLYYAYDIDYTWEHLTLRVVRPNGMTREAEWDRNLGARGSRKDFVIHTEEFPYFISAEQDGRQAGLLIIRPRETLGSMAMQPPRIVGLDYGTTSTIAFYRSSSQEQSSAHPFQLPSQVLPVAGLMDDSMAQRLALDFANLEALGSALYLSLLHVHGAAQDHITPFEMSNVLFARQIELDDEMKDRTFINLKLSTMGADLSKIRAFLMQVIMMYLWQSYHEGCREVYWRFSYPRSLSEKMQKTYRDSVESILAGLNHGVRNHVDFRSESQAIGSFITAPDLIPKIMAQGWEAVSNSAGYLCMDIGGGTVDFSLWQDRRLCGEASLMNFAGNYILCDTITREFDRGMQPRTDLLDQMLRGAFFPAASEMLEILTQLSTQTSETEKLYKRFRMLWATHIDSISTAIVRSHPLLIATEYSGLRAYLNMVELYLCLLFYFAGMMVGAAAEEGLLRPRPGERFSILLTGNGARMLEMLPEGKLESFRGSPLYNRLVLCFSVAQHDRCPDLGTPQIISPFMAKEEVAYGLTHEDIETFVLNTPEEEKPVRRDGEALVDAFLGRMQESDPWTQEREEAKPSDFVDTPRNLDWIGRYMLDAPGKQELHAMYDRFFDALRFAQDQTGGDFEEFVRTLFADGTPQSDTASIVTALDREPSEYANNIAGVYARVGRHIVSLIR